MEFGEATAVERNEKARQDGSPLLTQRPWEILGISRASWFRLENRPHPIKLQGLSCRRWRVKDLVNYINGLPLNKRPGKPIGVSKSTPEPSVN